MSNISSFCDWNRNLASDWTQHNILASSAHCIKIPISGNFLYIPPHQNPLWSVPPIPTKHAEKLIWTLVHSAREGSPLVKKRVHVNSGVLSLPIGDVQSAHILLRRGSHLNAERSDAAFLFPALSHTCIYTSLILRRSERVYKCAPSVYALLIFAASPLRCLFCSGGGTSSGWAWVRPLTLAFANHLPSRVRFNQRSTLCVCICIAMLRAISALGTLTDTVIAVGGALPKRFCSEMAHRSHRCELPMLKVGFQ